MCLLLIGRELAMTGFRWWASRRGVIIPAGGAGKLKTTIQNIFIGAIILWFAFRDARKPMGWEHSRYAEYWNQFHGGFVAVTLAVAALLTVYSFVAVPLPESATVLATSAPVTSAAAARSLMNIELVTIGTELLLGFTVDTNGAEIARALPRTACGSSAGPRGRPGGRDPRGRVRRRSRRTGAVLTTGGLGPTRDDITKKVVADLFGAPLEFDERIWAACSRASPGWAARRSQSNRSQAEVPRGATVLPNRWGTAPGLWLEGAPGLVIMLPGVPARDAEAAGARGGAPARRPGGGARDPLARWCGPPGFPSPPWPSGWARSSATIAPLTLAYLPGLEGVDLRLSAWSLPADEADRRLRAAADLLRQRAGEYVYGEGDDDLAALVLERARAQGLRHRRRPSRAPAASSARG